MRKFLTDTDNAKWEALKARAGRVRAALQPVSA
jgi:hypothetical protein